MGIGLLSLPLAFKYSGWVLGGIILTLSGAVTLYTARILARCMEVDPTLITYADIGWYNLWLESIADREACIWKSTSYISVAALLPRVDCDLCCSCRLVCRLAECSFPGCINNHLEIDVANRFYSIIFCFVEHPFVHLDTWYSWHCWT